jgi:hypothetical protein
MMSAMRLSLIAMIASLALAGPAHADWRNAPVVPEIDAVMASSLDRRIDESVAAGNDRNVFAKLGDSITESQAFLRGIACEEESLGRWTDLRPTIDAVHSAQLPDRYTDVWCGYADSFSRASAGARTGQTAAWATTPGDGEGECVRGETPLACEYRLLRPTLAIVMFGTNDAGFVATGAYRDAMARIVEESLARGTVPILSTLPPRLDDRSANRRVNRFNAIVARLARRNRLPLVNFWRATRSPRMVDQGMHADGIHPNVYSSYECDPFCAPLDFGREGLRYGYNQRNLITLRTLDRIRSATLAK